MNRNHNHSNLNLIHGGDIVLNDEIASDNEISPSLMGGYGQLDGNNSPSSCESDDDDTFADLYRPLIMPKAGESELEDSADLDSEAGSIDFEPGATSTQILRDDVDPGTNIQPGAVSIPHHVYKKLKSNGSRDYYLK